MWINKLERGVTLSELLMSVSCIGIVIIILFPVASNMVKNVNGSLTTTSLSHIESAIALYELENSILPLGGEVDINELPDNFKESLMLQAAENSGLEGQELKEATAELIGNLYEIDVDQLENYLSDTKMIRDRVIVVSKSSNLLPGCHIRVKISKAGNIENMAYGISCS